MEVLFVTWFCYLFWLHVIYFGTHGARCRRQRADPRIIAR